jgi:uncharacterized glyoxalase superfamily protein PhnB
MKVTNLRPILWTKNLQETIDFYVTALGFTCRYQIERFAALTKDNIEIMIVVPIDEPEDCKDLENKGDFFSSPNFTGSIYIDVENADEYWEQLKDKVKVKSPIENAEWHVRGFSIFDNNGYELVFGQDINDDFINLNS